MNISFEFYNIKAVISGCLLVVLDFKHPDRSPLQELIAAIRKPPNTVKLAPKPRCDSDSAMTRLSKRFFAASNERFTPDKIDQ
jgi:hypothetical protein